MARVELNIVALGDFTSINSSIKALQLQVDALNKSVAGVGLGTSLTKDLNSASAAFKNTMLSTGQFTQQTVQLRTETEKFGQALQNGKLSLGQYYSIIRQQSGTAMSNVKALALEQTKLQNSVITADPTKQGFYSVFTPTRINEVTNATKIAANEQNIYNLAVQEGSKSLINWGKNTQWAGRQLTVGMSVPLMLFGQQAASVFKDVNDQIVRLQKVYGTGLQQPSKQALDAIKQQTLGLAKELASSMGIAVKDTASMAADLAATGKTGVDLITATREAMRLSKLGELSTQDAMNTTISLQNVYKLNTNQLSDAVNFLNAVENQTSTSLQDLAAGIPKVGPIVEQLGGSFKDTAVMMVAMKEAGVPAAQSANAIKSAIASLINPTVAAKKAFAAFNIDVGSIATENKGNPVKMIMSLQQALKGLAPLAQSQLIEKLFGKFQEARIQALITNLGAANSQTKTAFDLMNANSAQLAGVANSEMKTATESVTGKYQRAMETFKADLIPVGQKILEIATALMGFANSISKAFAGLPGPIKSILGIAAIGTALAGPVIMLTGLMANFLGYIIKTVFSFKQLITGGTTLKQLFTPEVIASTQAADLFSKGIMNDVDSVDLLNQAIKNLTISMEGLVSTMGASTEVGLIAKEAGIITQMHLPGFASGGTVPGTGNGDTYPALLTPGEKIIPKDKAAKYAPFINAMIQGDLPGFAKGLGIGRSGDKIATYPEYAVRLQSGAQNSIGAGAPGRDEEILSPLALRIGEARGIKPSKTQVAAGSFDPIAEEYSGIVKNFNDKLKKHYDDTFKHITDADERYKLAWTKAGQDVEKEVNLISKDVDKGVIRKVFGLDPDVYGSIQTATDRPTETTPSKARKPIQNVKSTNVRGFSSLGQAARALFERRSNTSATGMEMGHVYGPREESMTEILSRPNLSKGARDAGEIVAKRTAENVVSEINIAAEAASPSKATKRAATNLVDGVVTGIKEGAPKVRSTSQSVSQTSLPGFENYGTVGPTEEPFGPSMENGKFTQNTGLLGKIKGKVMTPEGKLGIQSKMALSGGLMMGGQMIASQLPKGSNISNITSSVSSMAGMGMMFGPWGAAAGAALGLVTGGIGALMKAEKEHQAIAQASFTASAAAITAFGGSLKPPTDRVIHFTEDIKQAGITSQKTLTEIQAASQAIGKLGKDDPMKKTADAIKGYKSVGSVVGTIKQFAAAQVAAGMDPKGVQKMVAAMLQYAGKTQYLKAALKEIIPATKDAGTAQQTLLSKLVAAAGATNTSWSINRGFIKTYKDLNKEQKNLADGFGTVGTSMIDGNATAKTLIASMNALDKSGLDAYTSGTLLAAKLNEMGQTDLAKRFTTINSVVGDTGKSMMIATAEADGLIKNLDKLALTKLIKDPKAMATLAAQIAKYNSDAAKAAAAQAAADAKAKAAADAKTAAASAAASAPFAGTAEEKKVKKILEARVGAENKILKGLKDQLAAEQKVTAEKKRQFDYDQQRQDLANQAKEALISGNFLQAAMLKQQAAGATVDFNAGTKDAKAQEQIDTIQARTDVFSEALGTLTDAIANNVKVIDKKILSVAKMPILSGAPAAGGASTTVHVNVQAGANAAATAKAVHDKLLKTLATHEKKTTKNGSTVTHTKVKAVPQ
jgi:TP901 family phage tail tape measure protein